ncbi:MAG: Fe-S-containing hydro-lyase [Christensenellales bacterium]
MNSIPVQMPFDPRQLLTLRAGDAVSLSGYLYTGRDAAHKRLTALIQRGEPLPLPLENQCIYYVGPAPASPGHIIGSAGPTTSYRMDAYTPALLKLGLKGMIGKGLRSIQVVEAMKENGAVYFGAVGGAAALIARSIVSCEVVAYQDLGAEAIHRLEVKDFPVIVLIDSLGNSLYETGPALYRQNDL